MRALKGQAPCSAACGLFGKILEPSARILDEYPCKVRTPMRCWQLQMPVNLGLKPALQAASSSSASTLLDFVVTFAHLQRKSELSGLNFR